ncbi:MAG: CRISPR-associated endoribonuclease Cas6 [Bacteroidetes bacterium]|nr:CRISPR-associated endoribonuclease Cas6 [Bacteroidota bacterium]
MRFKLILSTINNKNILPLNYQYEISSCIYKIISNADKKFASWLHDSGYVDDSKKFKLFTFSNFKVPEYKINGDRMLILSHEIEMQISFLPAKSIEYFVTGLFKNQHFVIADQKSQVNFIVNRIETMKEPAFSNEMTFKSLSPICISHKNENCKYPEYLQPKGEIYKKLFLKNLVEKYNIFYKKQAEFNNNDFSLDILSKPKSRLITIKANTKEESKIRGYTYKFKIKAAKELLRLGYYAGFGEKNSMGFGCCEVVKEIKT